MSDYVFRQFDYFLQASTPKSTIYLNAKIIEELLFTYSNGNGQILPMNVRNILDPKDFVRFKSLLPWNIYRVKKIFFGILKFLKLKRISFLKCSILCIEVEQNFRTERLRDLMRYFPIL